MKRIKLLYLLISFSFSICVPCLSQTTGTPWTWGSNSFGQLGNGTTTNSNSPEQVFAIANAAAISSGGFHTLAILNDGTVWAWGNNDHGQLGNGTNENSNVPVQVSVDLEGTHLTNIAAVAAGRYHSLALDNNGYVWAWGDNEFGQSGNGAGSSSIACRVGDYTDPLNPVYLSNVTAISAGGLHSLALRQDGTVWSWGSNWYGQLGHYWYNPGYTACPTGVTDYFGCNWNYPVQVTGLSGIRAIAAGEEHSLALKDDGTVWAWGFSRYGRTGNTSSGGPSAVKVANLADITAIAAGGHHSAALKSDKTVWAWGYDYYGQLGRGITKTFSALPFQVLNLTGVKALSIGGIHSLALKEDGTLWIWGCNYSGQLGDGTNADSNIPVPVSGLGNVIAISGGLSHSAAIVQNSSVKPGYRRPFLSGRFSKRHELNMGRYNFNVLPANSRSFTANKPSSVRGKLWAWGDNKYGQLGNGKHGEAEKSALPVQVVINGGPVNPGIFSDVISAAGGLYHSLAAKYDGTVWAWGRNAQGQLGNGTFTDSDIPVQVSGLTDIIEVAAGQDHSLALRIDGTVWAWGAGSEGQLGNRGVFSNPGCYSNIPVQVAALTTVIEIAAGYSQSCALKNDGTVWTWGHNHNGTLGNGSNIGSKVPVQVLSLTDAAAVAGGLGIADTFIALKNDGTSWAWGAHKDEASGNYGQLGDGTQMESTVPVKLANYSDVRAITRGLCFSLCLRENGTMWGWGYNGSGQLGNGSTTLSTVPVQVDIHEFSAAISEITAGGAYSFARTEDGMTWAWGANDGLFGDGAATGSHVPVKVPNLANISRLASAYRHCMAIVPDGLCLPLNISPPELPGAFINGNYYQEISAGRGNPPYNYSIAPGSSLPTGLNLSSAGILSGTPEESTPENFELAVNVTDNNGCQGSTRYRLYVSPFPPEIAKGYSMNNALIWSSDKTQLSWPPEILAAGYKLYRGNSGNFLNLGNTNIDSCTIYDGTSSAFAISDDPSSAEGKLYWYLVTGYNANGEGSAGKGTSLPRIINSSGSCP
jgi:alpha-tubulin suppressor-like RCC1 family protein